MNGEQYKMKKFEERKDVLILVLSESTEIFLHDCSRPINVPPTLMIDDLIEQNGHNTNNGFRWANNIFVV